MKQIALLSAVLLLVVAVFAASKKPEELYPKRITSTTFPSEAELRTIFTKWVVQYNKPYLNDLKTLSKRFQNFKDNLEIVKKMNDLSETATYGITKFFDLSQAEFRQQYLSKEMPFPKNAERLDTKKAGLTAPAPDNWNWAEKGAVSFVKDQGQCGSCWAYSTTGNIESRYKIAKNLTELVILSEDQLIDCDHECDPDDPTTCDQGCDGGLMSNAFRWIIKNDGIATLNDYSSCKHPGPIGAKIDNWTMLTTNETDLANWLYNYGPISVAMDATPLQYYKEGSVGCREGSKTDLNHGVLITGYAYGKPWWIFKASWWWTVKNSWGEDWGEHGYFNIDRNCGACGINTFACTSLIN